MSDAAGSKGGKVKIRICLAGATGNVGRALAHEILRSEDLELVGAVSRTYQNRNLGEVLGTPKVDLKISGTVQEAFTTKADVLIDYTNPSVVKGHVLFAIDRGTNVVIGTSGLTEEDYVEIDSAARSKGVGVLAGGNFAITAILMQRFALMAAKHIPHWEIVDYANANKIDAASGTSSELAARLSQIRKPVLKHPVEETHGPKESRGASIGGAQVHSIRLPGYGFSAEVIFGMANEKLIIRHEAGVSSEPYVAGTLFAARKVVSFVGLVMGIDHFMNF